MPFSRLASENEPHMRTLIEWINPITDGNDGRREARLPFRKGVSAAVRITTTTLFEIAAKINWETGEAGKVENETMPQRGVES